MRLILLLIFNLFYLALISQDVFVDFNSDISHIERAHTVEKKPPVHESWPRCEEPRVKLTHDTNEDFLNLSVLNYDEVSRYRLKFWDAESQDSVERVFHKADTLLLKDNDYHNLKIRRECSDVLHSSWVFVEVDEIPSRSSCSFPTMHWSKFGGKLYMSLMTSGNQLNNHLYSNYLQEHLRIKINWSANSSTELFSREPISTFINPNNQKAYIYIVDLPANYSNLGVQVFFGNIDNCETYTNTSGCTSGSHRGCGFQNDIETYINNNTLESIAVDASHFLCSNTLCDDVKHYDGQFKAKGVGSNIIINTNNFNTNGFLSSLGDTIQEIKLKVKYQASNQVYETTKSFWKKNTAFNPESWNTSLIIGNTPSSYFDVQLTFHITYTDGTVEECSNYMNIAVDPSNLVCVLFEGIKTKVSQNGTPQLTFSTHEHINNFPNLLEALAITGSQLDQILSGTSIHYTVMDGTNIKATTEYNYISSSDLESRIDDLPFSFISGHSYSVNIKVKSGSEILNDCTMSPAIFNAVGSGIGLDCGQEYAPLNITNQNSVELQSNMNITINNFPLLVLSASGDTDNGYVGRGKIPLPYGDKELFVTLNNIKINSDNVVFAGSVTGETGAHISSLPDFNVPPVFYGGEICVPPPTEGNFDGSGIDKTTGLDGYGFDPKTNLHHITKTPYDPDGYDIDGNHKDTNAPYNEDGCSRDGKLYEEDETGKMVLTDKDCDKSGPLSDEHHKAIVKWKEVIDNNFDTIIKSEQNRLNEQIKVQKQNCQSLINYVHSEKYLTYDDAGSFKDLLGEGLSSKFNVRPKNKTLQPRNNTILNLESKTLEWYDCDIELSRYKHQKTLISSALEQMKKNCLLEKIKKEMEELSSSEIDLLKDEQKLHAWIVNKVYILLETECGQNIGYLQLETEALDIGTASLQETSPSFDAIENLEFLYNQGHDVIGYMPRPYITERIYEYMQASGNVDSQLPIQLKRNYNNFTVDIYISDVTLYPTSGTMNVGAILTDHKDNNKKIAFGGSSVPLTAGVQNVATSKLFLISDIGIRLNNASRLFLNGGQGKTYISWDCEGFKELQVSGAVQFCREYVLPLDQNFDPIENEEVLYELNTSIAIQDFDNFTFSCSAPPFELPNLQGYRFTVDSIRLDFSEKEGGLLQTTLPSQYQSVFQSNGSLSPLWKGFYAENIVMTLPPNLLKRKGEPVKVTVPYFIIDDWGLTTRVVANTGQDLVSFNDGSANGWQLSIADYNITIVHNSIVGGGFGGVIALPIADVPLEYMATFYKSGISFEVNPEQDMNFTPFIGKLRLDKSSYLLAEYIDNKFYAKAHLNGDIVPEIGIGLPKVTFRGFEVDNRTLDDGRVTLGFTPGYWGIDTSKITTMHGLPISVSKFNVKSAGQDTVVFSIGVRLNIIEDKLSAEGDLDIFSKTNVNDVNKVLSIKYLDYNLNSLYIDASINNILTLKGYIHRFDETKSDDINLKRFGSGYRGGLLAQLSFLDSSPEIMALGQFGKTDTMDYFFVDMLLNTAGLIDLGGLSIDRLGGGMYTRMSPDYTSFQPNPNIKFEDIPGLKMGVTLSGVQYVPNSQIALGLKLMTSFSSTTSDAFSGTGEIDVNFLDNFVLNKISLRASCQFLTELSPSLGMNLLKDIPSDLESLVGSRNLDSIPKVKGLDAAISGYAYFEFDKINYTFKGSVATFLNTPGGHIRGSKVNGGLCMVDIFFGKKDWWIYMGTPSDRSGIDMNVGLTKLKLSSYLNIGTKIPPFPGLPHRFKHLRNRFNFNQLSRQSGAGFAFGADLKFTFEAQALGTGLRIDAGAGFDIMLKKFSDVKCLSDGANKEIGLDGWYAAGQAWVYLDGEVTLLYRTIFKGGIAAVLQIQTPNPTYIYGNISAHFGKHEWDGSLEFGEKCILESSGDSFNQELILSTSPYAQDSLFQVSHIPRVDFALPLKTTIEDFHLVGDSNPKDITFAINTDSTGLFRNGYKIATDNDQDWNINYISFFPVNYLAPDTDYQLIVKIDVYADNKYLTSRRKIVDFRTSDAVPTIDDSNILWTYPVEGMHNFHPENYTREYGYIALRRNQYNIFADESKEVIVRITGSNGSVDYEGPAEYDDSMDFGGGSGNYDNIIKYALPSARLQPSTYYKVQLIRREKQAEQSLSPVSRSIGSKGSTGQVVYENYFRTSQYKTIDQKVALLASSAPKPSGHRAPDPNSYNHVNIATTSTTEPFGPYEISSGSKNMVRFYKNPIKDDLHEVYVKQIVNTTFWPLEYYFKYQKSYSSNRNYIQASEKERVYNGVTKEVYESPQPVTGEVKLYCIDDTENTDIDYVYYTFPWGEVIKLGVSNVHLKNRYSHHNGAVQDLTSTISDVLINPPKPPLQNP